MPATGLLGNAAARLQRLRGESAWALLRADSAPVVLAMLRAELVDSGEPRVAAHILIERVADDLVELRAAGHDLPRTAQQYCAEWLAAGYLERRPGDVGGDETYELSAEAIAAVRVVDELGTPPRTATESRLTTVMDQLARLVVDTEPDPSARVDALLRERDRLDAHIEDVRSGRIGATDPRVALERVRDVLDLADQLPADFTRVRREIERLNGRFRKDIIDSDGGRGEVLDALFRGVDVLADEEAGRSFRAFYALLVDLDRHEAFGTDIETVLTRSFAAALDDGERDVLRQIVPQLIERGGEVHEVYVSLARGLRGFVQHRGYLEEREVGRLLTQAQRRLGELSQTVPLHRATGFELHLGAAHVGSVGQWALHEPDGERPEPLTDEPVLEVDLDQLRALVRESEIDLRELAGNVDAALDDAPVASLRDVLTQFPATQGLGSVVGLVHLAVRRLADGTAIEVADECETVPWGADPPRLARVPRLLFVRTPDGSEHTAPARPAPTSAAPTSTAPTSAAPTSAAPTSTAPTPSEEVR